MFSATRSLRYRVFVVPLRPHCCYSPASPFKLYPFRNVEGRRFNSIDSSKSTSKPSISPPRTSGEKQSWLSRFLPASVSDTTKSASSFRKIVALARPEAKPLGIAVSLLLVSSTVSMSIPFTIGKLIDYFTSTHPVCLWHFSRLFAIIDVEREFDVANPFWIVSWTSFGYPSFFVYYRRISKRRPCYAYARLGPANCCAFA